MSTKRKILRVFYALSKLSVFVTLVAYCAYTENSKAKCSEERAKQIPIGLIWPWVNRRF